MDLMKRLVLCTAVVLALCLYGCQKTENVKEAPASSQQTESIQFKGSIEVQGSETPLLVSYVPNQLKTLDGILSIRDQKITFTTKGARLGFVDNGFRVVDLNQDHLQDVIVDLGFVEENAFSGCYVQKEDGSFIPVEGFDTLELPYWSEKGQFLVVPKHESSSIYVINHYVIQGNQLFLSERLVSDYTSGPLYAIEKMQDGKLVTVEENLTEANVDLNYWYLG